MKHILTLALVCMTQFAGADCLPFYKQRAEDWKLVKKEQLERLDKNGIDKPVVAIDAWIGALIGASTMNPLVVAAGAGGGVLYGYIGHRYRNYRWTDFDQDLLEVTHLTNILDENSNTEAHAIGLGIVKRELRQMFKIETTEEEIEAKIRVLNNEKAICHYNSPIRFNDFIDILANTYGVGGNFPLTSDNQNMWRDYIQFSNSMD